MDLPRALSLHAFDDPSGVTGRAAYDLGNAYQINGARSRNGTLLAQMYFLPLTDDWPMHRVRDGGFEDTRDELANASPAGSNPLRMRRADARADRRTSTRARSRWRTSARRSVPRSTRA